MAVLPVGAFYKLFRSGQRSAANERSGRFLWCRPDVASIELGPRPPRRRRGGLRGRAMRGVTPALSACRRPLHRRLPGEWQAYCVTAAIARNARARDRPRTPAPENPENINLRQSPKQRRARDLDAMVPARGRERLRRLEGRRARPMRPGIALPPDQRHALTEWPVPVGCCLTFSSITAIDP